ncbi:DEAD/DEAH box helicase [Rhizobium ruizarguesonis]
MTQSCFEAMSEAMSIRLEHRDETGKVSRAGLRKTQLAAAYAGAAHALHSQEAATIAMPTGTGKSAVMILVSALVKARRVLVIVASARLREELAEKFSEVDPFRRLEMLKSKIAPRVRRVYNRITDEAGWRALDEADVVVGLPQTLSPAYKGVCPPPSGFFDLALIDEGHHAPAETWRKLIEDLGPIPKILFSATPYRLDRRRMPGPIIHTYSARAAYRDGVFGKIVYHAVAPGGGETPDQAICRATLARFKEDSEKGLDHRYMVKASTRRRAQKLKELYEAEGARIAVVTSSYAKKTNDRAVERLRAGELDGLICVRMLGEGFDEPRLKIAALHDPDKSLPITLQFIGRFARTTEKNIGQASFLSVAEVTHVVDDLRALYRRDSIWNEIVASQADGAIIGEKAHEDYADRIRSTGRVAAREPLSEAFWEQLRPRQKADVFDCRGVQIDMSKMKTAFDRLYLHYALENEDTAILVTEKPGTPSWLVGDAIATESVHLHLAYYSKSCDLLFFHASADDVTLRDNCIRALAGKSLRGVLFRDLARVFAGTKLLAPFNVGLRTRQYGDGAESYRSSAGRAAGDAFGAMEAVRYVRGHLAAKIDDDEILGMSESSKLWGGQNVSVQEFAQWCERLGAAIRSDNDPRGRRGYFGVPFVVPLSEIPARVVAADWPLDVYSKPLTLVRVSEVPVTSTRLQDPADEVSPVPSPLSLLLDCAIEIASRPQPSDQMSLRIRWASGYTTVSYQPGARQVFRATERKSGTGFVPTDQLLVRRGGNYEKFLDFINAQPPTLYSIDGAIIVGAEGTEPLAELPLVPSEETFVEKIWPATVDIRKERLSDEFPRRIESIQDEIARELIAEDFDVVFHDDGSGELADLITIRQIASEGLLQDVEITLWHAKYSGSDDPGRRLQDQYEVLGQAIKSGRRLTYSAVRAHIDRRHQKGGHHKFLAGDIDMMRLLLSGDAMQKYLYRIKVVQPGTSISKVSADIKQIVAAAAHLIEYGGLNRFEYIASP